MGRKQKVSAQEVLETLENNGVITLDEIAKNHEVTKSTIRKRIQELRTDGIAVLPTKEGLLYLDPNDSLTKEQAESINQTGNWIIGEIVGLSKIGNITRKPLIQVRKILSLNKSEMAILKKNLSIISSLVNTMDVERELLE